jgi:hypothetical protein
MRSRVWRVGVSHVTAMSMFEIIQSVASIATAVGVGIAAWQLWLTKRQAQSQFEDAFAEQYRRITTALPLHALLGRPLSEQELESSLRTFYNYFDLSNEQAFLAENGRLRRETWINWREGIQQHLQRPAFSQARKRLAPDLDGSFDDLKRLLPVDLRIGASRSPNAANLIESLTSILSDEDEGIAEAFRRDAEIATDPAQAISLAELDAHIQDRRG